jgi:molybdopterin/thiamine biosynthesis adenylyltransferase
MQQFDDRFKDAPWYLLSKDEKILLVGVGGIGSNTLYSMVKTIPAKYHILDNDLVEERNIGTQFFFPKDKGKSKVFAVKDSLMGLGVIYPVKQPYIIEYYPITVTGLDNMETRKKVFNVWKNRDNRELFIDGRLRANYYEIYVVTPGKEEEYEKTLFEDKDVDEGPCTFKQTAYFAVLIGARITQVVVNYLINKYSGEEICAIPFKISELSEPFYIEIT